MPILTRGGYARPATALEFKTGTWRIQKPKHHHYAAPCHSACPAGEDAQAYLARVEEGNLRGAWEILVSANPLPAITGRVCDHPCETACNRGQLDEAVAIHSVERFLGDEAIANDWSYQITPPNLDAPRVAVVGAGPAGIANAYHLLRQGFNVTLFDALPEFGGTLHTAIPAYRLPRDVSIAEIERVFALGVDFRPRHRLGRDMSLKELQSDYPALFLAPGALQGRQWSVGGVTPKDLHQGLELLKQWMDVGTIPISNSVAVVGGGNTAVDVARVMKRAGVPEVHIITHNGLPGPDAVPGDVMRAIPREVSQSQEEGVIIHEHRGIRRLILRGEKVIGVEMVHMKKLRNQDGRLQRVAFDGTETVLHVDQVIPAIGQEVDAAGMESVLKADSFFKVDDWGAIAALPGVWAGGDARINNLGTVSSAVGDGRRAALAMAAYVRDRRAPEKLDRLTIGHEQLNLNYFEMVPRAHQPVIALELREGDREIEGGLDIIQVASEARRCFSCGNCMSCDNCWTLCPDSAVLKNPTALKETDRYVFDYDYCKGCGLCAKECPCGFIEMVDEL